MKLPAKHKGRALDRTEVALAALPAATLSPGWYPDPHLRWKARYWDGRVWTERVAAAGQALPVFGQDPLAAPEHTDADVTPTLVRLVDAVCTAELAHLRAEVETWRGVAEERERALTTALNALESLAAQHKQLSTEPTERSADQWRATRTPTSHPDPRTEPRDSTEIPAAVEAPAAKSSLVSIPDKVRTAALAELHTMTLKQQRWWQRSLYTRRNS